MVLCKKHNNKNRVRTPLTREALLSNYVYLFLILWINEWKQSHSFITIKKKMPKEEKLTFISNILDY